jgi:hypothetical protein
MLRSSAALIAGLALLAVGIGLLVWFQIDWSAAHPGEAATPLTALAEWRGQVGYAAGLLGLGVTFQAAYAAARRRAQ